MKPEPRPKLASIWAVLLCRPPYGPEITLHFSTIGKRFMDET